MRVFFAIELPDQIKDIMTGMLSTLKNAHHHQIIRWTNPNDLHITLQFMGSIKNADIEMLLKHTQDHLQDCAPFRLKLCNLELFPSASHPHVISINMIPEKPLALVAALIGQAISECGYPVDSRPFRPHLTLGKIKSEHFIPQLDIPRVKIPEFNVNEIILFRSEPDKDGSNYFSIGKIKLITEPF